MSKSKVMQCATLQAAADDVGGFTAILAPGATVPAGGATRGTSTDAGAPVTVSCPDGEVVVGASGSAGAHVQQVTLRCAARRLRSAVTGRAG